MVVKFYLYYYSRLSKWKKRTLTTKELFAVLEEVCQNGGSIDIVYVSPDTDEASDEEDIDENIIGEERMETDIARTYEIQLNIDSGDSEDDIALSKIAKRAKIESQKSTKLKLKIGSHLIKTEITTYSTFPQYSFNRFLENIKAEYGGKSPYEDFVLFLDKEVSDRILYFTNICASQENRKVFEINELDL